MYLVPMNFFHAQINVLRYTQMCWDWLGVFVIIISIFFLLRYNLENAFFYGIVGTSIMTIMFIIVIVELFIFNSLTITLIFELLPIILLYSINCIIYLLMYYSPTIKEEALVKRIILEMGTKFSRTEIKEVSEKSRVDITSIIKIVKQMITNQEIHGIYFNSTETIAFNQQSNIKEIDNLMAQYKQWEEINIGKTN